MKNYSLLIITIIRQHLLNTPKVPDPFLGTVCAVSIISAAMHYSCVITSALHVRKLGLTGIGQLAQISVGVTCLIWDSGLSLQEPYCLITALHCLITMPLNALVDFTSEIEFSVPPSSVFLPLPCCYSTSKSLMLPEFPTDRVIFVQSNVFRIMCYYCLYQPLPSSPARNTHVHLHTHLNVHTGAHTHTRAHTHLGHEGMH